MKTAALLGLTVRLDPKGPVCVEPLVRIVRGCRSRVQRRDGQRGQRSPLGRLLIRLLDGDLDFVSINSMTAVSAALSRK
jgi:hypothetical protein